MNIYFQVLLFLAIFAISTAAHGKLEKDIIKTSQGDLVITFIGHGSLMFNFKGKNIFVDPYSRLIDYSTMPKADLILITHEHGDHLDLEALKNIRTDKTAVIISQSCASVVSGIVMKNDEKKTIMGLSIEAVPAYNIVNKRNNVQPFHPKGIGNGYIVTFGDKKVYIAGDSENTPEMKALKNIDIAFLPMNLPYTMTPEMLADAAKAFMPKILYPYHYGDTDVSKLLKLMKDTHSVDIRIRQMK